MRGHYQRVREITPVEVSDATQLREGAVSRASTAGLLTGGWRFLRPVYRGGTSPCSAACPAGCAIEKVMFLAAREQFAEALALWREDNPLIGVCGRACYHPCEAQCNRAACGGALAIHALERFLSDWEATASRRRPKTTPPPPRAPRVAVIGAGPAGLSCAYHLSRRGVRAVIYDAHEKPGGLLRYGIPAYRLPPEILDRDLDFIRRCGVRFRMNTRVGDQVSFAALRAEYAAVYLAPGYPQTRKLALEGEEAPGVWQGLDFLYQVAQGGRKAPGRKVLVVGGGNTALDSARCARRLGAEVTIVYRRARQQMPAHDFEIEAAEREGVRLKVLLNPVRLLVGRDGRLRGARCEHQQLGLPDATGRPRPEPTGRQTTLPCDALIVAIGQAPELSFLGEDCLVDEAHWCLVERESRRPVEGVLCGGDLVSAEKTLTHAIGSGKQAALALCRYLEGAPFGEALKWLRAAPHSLGAGTGQTAAANAEHLVGLEQLNLDHLARVESVPPPRRALPPQPEDFAEIEQTYDRESARAEAGRCFNCGWCTACDLCFIFCPDAAVHRLPAGGYGIDYDYCKGCGICVAECPRGAMSLEREAK